MVLQEKQQFSFLWKQLNKKAFFLNFPTQTQRWDYFQSFFNLCSGIFSGLFMEHIISFYLSTQVYQQLPNDHFWNVQAFYV